MFTFTNVPLMLTLFIFVGMAFWLMFRSLRKDSKDEEAFYNSLSEREKMEYNKTMNRELGSKHASVIGNSISNSRKF